MNKEQINKLSGIFWDSAIELHKHLGPGLLESVYEVCLFKQPESKGINFLRQVTLPVRYKGELLDADYKIDVLVENEIVIELKAV